MDEQQMTSGATRRTNAELAARYTRRATKALAGDDDSGPTTAQAFIGLANVHATLALADAIRDSRGE